jgi:hypothetical protein
VTDFVLLYSLRVAVTVFVLLQQSLWSCESVWCCDILGKVVIVFVAMQGSPWNYFDSVCDDVELLGIVVAMWNYFERS